MCANGDRIPLCFTHQLDPKYSIDPFLGLYCLSSSGEQKNNGFTDNMQFSR